MLTKRDIYLIGDTWASLGVPLRGSLVPGPLGWVWVGLVAQSFGKPPNIAWVRLPSPN